MSECDCICWFNVLFFLKTKQTNFCFVLTWTCWRSYLSLDVVGKKAVKFASGYLWKVGYEFDSFQSCIWEFFHSVVMKNLRAVFFFKVTYNSPLQVRFQTWSSWSFWNASFFRHQKTFLLLGNVWVFLELVLILEAVETKMEV